MQRFNLSEWAITHRPLVLFMILLLGVAGAYSYLNLGRAEDPSFTIKTMVVNVAWPGATATEMQTQVADKIEKKLQELPYLDRVESYSQPGVSFIQVFLERHDAARQGQGAVVPGAQEGRRHPRANCLPASSARSFNDEYGDVYSALYMLTADGLSLAELKARAEDIRQRLLRVADVNKVDIIGERPREDLHRVQPRQARHLGVTPQQIFDSVARQNAVVSGGSVDTSADRINLRVTGAFAGRRRHRRGAGPGGRPGVPARRHRDRQARLRGPAELHRARGRQAGARPRRLHAGRRQHHHARPRT